MKFRKDLESQEKVREFVNKWLWQSSEFYLFCLKDEWMYFLMR